MKYLHAFLVILFALHFSFVFGDLYDPVSVYLTWQQDPSTTMTISWITDKDRDDDVIEYQKVGDTDWLTITGTHVPMPQEHPYLIHRVELTHLLPDSKYIFRTGDDAVAYMFRTMSDDPNAPIRFVVGGDMYHDSMEVLKQMNHLAASYNPMFVLAGGDLCYAHEKKPNQFSDRNLRWIDFMVAWKETMVTQDGCLIPILPVIGNHDVNGRYGQTPEQSPFFYALFPMPGKQGYNVLDFGNFMSIILLDSGHTHPVKGVQAFWLYNTLKQRQDVPHKFAVYHVAAYPSVSKRCDKKNAAVRYHWVPIFEQFGLTAAFEHHEHAYKRTPPIYRNAIDPTHGVIYLGDGAWGVNTKLRKPKKAEKKWYLEKTAKSLHFYLVDVERDTCHFTAIDNNGQMFDETVRVRQDFEVSSFVNFSCKSIGRTSTMVGCHSRPFLYTN